VQNLRKYLRFCTHYFYAQCLSTELRVRAINNGSETVLVSGSKRIGINRKDDQLEFRTPVGEDNESSVQVQPHDYSLLVKDGYRF